MTQRTGADALDLEGEELARITSDILALCDEYRHAMRTMSVWSEPDLPSLDRLLKEGIPEEPAPWTETRNTLRHVILRSQAHLAHPRFLAFVPNPNNAVSNLKTAIEIDRASDRAPFCVVATAGTTNTGAVDPLPDLSRICREQGIWLHVDGAYGGAAALCAEGRACLLGMDLADSVTLDPHKWLFQPYPCSCLLVRDADQLRRAFHVQAEYLQDADGDWNLWDYGPELTRPFRGLKLWLSLQVFGAAAFRRAVAKGIQIAEFAESRIREMPGWQLVTPASLGILTFRYAGQAESETRLDEINEAIAGRCLADGFSFVVTTKVAGRTVLRFCTINPRTTEADITETLNRLHAFGQGFF